MGILDGFRILDFTQHQAGPYGTALLADFGADVVKIERPGGDPGRTNHPQVEGVNAFFLVNNRGKRSLCLDLTKPAALEIVRRLLTDADALVHNLKPGAMEKLGLGYESVRTLNPRIVYAAASTFGPAGPRASLTGVDLLAQAESGIMSVTGPDGGDALPVGAAIADALGGINLAFGVVSALLARERSGTGQEVHVSLVGGLLGIQAWELQHHLLSKAVPPRGGRSHPLIKTLWQSFTASDGSFVLAEVKDSWGGICGAIGRPELVADERFDRVGRRLKNRSELIAILDESFGRWTVAECVERLRTEGVLAAPVRTYADIAADLDARANGYVQALDHPDKGRMETPGPFIHFSKSPAAIRSAAPTIGEHTAAILAEVGYTRDEVERLRYDGVIP
jgi:crotonobetainyl-CoA:carnitine CoA-transferase CaiB-like acyl-CoA transferase